MGPNGFAGPMPTNPTSAKTQEDGAAEIPLEEQPEYGLKLIGDAKTLSSTIEFAYFIYIDDELKR